MSEVEADNTASLSVSLTEDGQISAALDNDGDISAETGPAVEYAERAGKLNEKRKIELTGQASGEAYFNGAEDVSIYTTIQRITNEELEGILV